MGLRPVRSVGDFGQIVAVGRGEPGLDAPAFIDRLQPIEKRPAIRRQVSRIVLAQLRDQSVIVVAIGGQRTVAE
ncbi:hypothetical protein POI8812_01038 [Pontivivens insulae]|uniref:Uncharacterized protein n=1 Tax=Pontivivens insulae TaxID=1639689 RepID=A0A2R8A9C3_9RHOB|nr:hypothetical protein DFR53_1037 [Pontivivens insulae]SPF28735.1 hypothetical protein POI8812_01038 [Pontivivens insulae]